MTFEKGKQYYIYNYEIGRINKIHVLELIETNYIVYKFFGKYKRRWFYKIEHIITVRGCYKAAVEERKSKRLPKNTTP
jgi:hypothetical protein